MVSVRDYLLEHGIRPSVQRIAVMNYLMTHLTHPTVDEIYLALLHDIPTLSRTTVYNTLRLFVRHQAAQAIDIDRSCERFDADTDLHAHFMCESCGRIDDIMIPHCQAIESLAPPATAVHSINLSFKGLCSNCTKIKQC